MARAFPMQTAFNNGEVSPYMYGRIDAQKYPLSLREMTNFLPLVQGPAKKRDGTRFVAPVADESESSRFFEFQFNPTQGYIIEMNSDRARFFTNRGLVIESEKSVSAVSTANPAVVTSASHGYVDGDQVLFPDVGNLPELANRVFTVNQLTANTFELVGFDGASLAASIGTVNVARVYSIDAPYAADDLFDVNYLQSLDELTLFHNDYQPRKLVRDGATDWSIENFDFKDGPYMTEDTQGTTLTPASTGAVTPDMTSNTAPSGTASNTDGDADAWEVFDLDSDTASSDQNLPANFTYLFPGGTTKVADAYWITSSNNANSANDSPSSWEFQGYNGTNWITLDSHDGETGWSTNETRYFSFPNETAFEGYRLNVTANDGDTSGPFVTIAEFGIHENGDFQTSFNLTASQTDGINDGDGFQSTDVGRTIRLLGSDARWRWARIDSVTSTTVVKIKLYGHSLPDKRPIARWRLGLYSDTTGWPACGAFFNDRLVLSGPTQFPHFVAFSKSGVYDTFTPSELDGTVVADNGFLYSLVEREVRSIRWFSSTDRGLIIGTDAAEGLARKPNSGEPFSGLNIEVVWPTNYGSANVRPIKADVATLFVQRTGRRVRELAYVLEADGFRAPNMSVMADHITKSGVKRVAFQGHPNSTLWMVRNDGGLIAFSYEREQNVTAWHKHNLGGEDVEVEEIGKIASPDGMSDDVWLIVKRTIDGATHRYIEYIGDEFDHETAQEDAVFVDSALIYDSTETSTVTGLHHLEGETVRILADGAQIEGKVVEDGTVTLDRAASTIIVGLPYKGRLWTMPRSENLADGTGRGRLKRVFRYVMNLYRSLGGKIGAGSGELNTLQFWSINNSITQPLDLFSGELGPFSHPMGWEKDGGIVIENDTAYPFIVTAILPQVDLEAG